MKHFIGIAVAGLVGLTQGGQPAACHWALDCSHGACRQIEACASAHDQPAPRRDAQATQETAAPRSCHEQFICDPAGNCTWVLGCS
jgi:hypothetical protein